MSEIATQHDDEAKVALIEQNQVKELLTIKDTQTLLTEQRERLEEKLPLLVIFQNEDKTWTRFTKTDNINELIEKGSFWGMHKVPKFQTKVSILKNKPKEIK